MQPAIGESGTAKTEVVDQRSADAKRRTGPLSAGTFRISRSRSGLLFFGGLSAAFGFGLVGHQSAASLGSVHSAAICRRVAWGHRQHASLGTRTFPASTGRSQLASLSSRGGLSVSWLGGRRQRDVSRSTRAARRLLPSRSAWRRPRSGGSLVGGGGIRAPRVAASLASCLEQAGQLRQDKRRPGRHSRAWVFMTVSEGIVWQRS
jgi:hypothetical protein